MGMMIFGEIPNFDTVINIQNAIADLCLIPDLYKQFSRHRPAFDGNIHSNHSFRLRLDIKSLEIES